MDGLPRKLARKNIAAIYKECLWIKCVLYDLLMLILYKNINSPRKQYTSFSLLTLKCCCVPGKSFFACSICQISSAIFFFSNWEPGTQPKLAHGYYGFFTVSNELDMRGVLSNQNDVHLFLIIFFLISPI